MHHQDIQEIVPGPSVHHQDIQEALPGSSVHQNIQETVPGPIVQRSPSIPPETLPEQTITGSPLITIISTNPCCSRDNTTLTPRGHKLQKRLHFVSKLRSDMKKRYMKAVKNLRSQLDVQRTTQIKYLNQELKRKQMALSAKEAKIIQLRKQFREKELSKKLKEKDKELQHIKRAFNCLKTTNSAVKLNYMKQSCDSVSFEEYQKVKKMLEGE